MRGFVVLFNTQPEVPRTPDDAIERRFAQWEAGFAPTRVQRLEHPNCRCYLYSASDAIPAAFNQRTWRTSTELLLWTGPRVDMTAADLLRAPVSHDLTELAAATLASPCALDTAVCISYRAAAHSLIVKTDVMGLDIHLLGAVGTMAIIFQLVPHAGSTNRRRGRSRGSFGISRKRLDLRE